MLIFELARYAQYKENAWYQYILNIDIHNIKTPFLITQKKYNEIIDEINLDIDTLKKQKWHKFLKIIQHTLLFESLQQLQNSDNIYLKKIIADFSNTKHQLTHKWKSKDIIMPLNYDNNFSNWIDAIGSEGYFYFWIDDKNNTSTLKIPIAFFDGTSGYYSIYLGKYQITYTQILIWQNDNFPVIIPYQIEEDHLILNLFNKNILFVKDK